MKKTKFSRHPLKEALGIMLDVLASHTQIPRGVLIGQFIIVAKEIQDEAFAFLWNKKSLNRNEIAKAMGISENASTTIYYRAKAAKKLKRPNNSPGRKKLSELIARKIEDLKSKGKTYSEIAVSIGKNVTLSQIKKHFSKKEDSELQPLQKIAGDLKIPYPVAQRISRELGIGKILGKQRKRFFSPTDIVSLMKWQRSQNT